MAVDTCAKCRWWSNRQSPPPLDWFKADCRRHAPIPPLRITLSTSTGYNSDPGAVFPQTGAADWCGDFERLRTDANMPRPE